MEQTGCGWKRISEKIRMVTEHRASVKNRQNIVFVPPFLNIVQTRFVSSRPVI